jgi:type 1 glutamine amidotransferase
VKVLILILLVLPVLCIGQHLYQQPTKPIPRAHLEKITGKTTKQKTEKEHHIIWVYGYDEHHIAGAHDYVKIKDLMTTLLVSVDNITVEEAFHFPSVGQFAKADLLVMYLHLPQLTDAQFSVLKKFVKDGGAILSLHETAIMRPSDRGKLLSECLGSAWNEGTSRWGAIFDLINIENDHPVFRGFPDKLLLNDEFYWDLFQEKDMKVLGTVRTGPEGDSEGPVAEDELSETESPVFWTYTLGLGKVFGTTTGHHTFTYYNPEFRIILFRAIAWLIDEKADPFMPLVYEGITNEQNMVGTTKDMRYWKGKIRK